MPSLRKILFSFLAVLSLFAGTLSPALVPIAAAATGGAVTADGTVPDSIPGETADQRQARLQAALDSVNKEIADNQAQLASAVPFLSPSAQLDSGPQSRRLTQLNSKYVRRLYAHPRSTLLYSQQ